ncbi:hypothetical protein FHS38_005664 [Streptomyces netropsis]|uniref:Uncharacterized protein n=1 Tax=Streptomyces netropsis TaxID=55404 RepID=A0A7W7LH51_STRNE|nr:hypothetical protein [Streptomyces netropsis]
MMPRRSPRPHADMRVALMAWPRPEPESLARGFAVLSAFGHAPVMQLVA